MHDENQVEKNQYKKNLEECRAELHASDEEIRRLNRLIAKSFFKPFGIELNEKGKAYCIKNS